MWRRRRACCGNRGGRLRGAGGGTGAAGRPQADRPVGKAEEADAQALVVVAAVQGHRQDIRRGGQAGRDADAVHGQDGGVAGDGCGGGESGDQDEGEEGRGSA